MRSGWQNYIKKVYPSIKDTDEIDISSFDFFYGDILISCVGHENLPPIIDKPNCPGDNQQGYLYQDMPGATWYAGTPGALWTYHTPKDDSDGYPPITSSKIEVMRCHSDGEPDGAWYYKAVGSGIYLDMGLPYTIFFKDHVDAVSHFVPNEIPMCSEEPNKECPSDIMEKMIEAARIKGYYTIQFRNHQDMRCDWGKKSNAIEILDIRPKSIGTYTCGSKDNSNLFSDWNGTQKCNCVESTQDTCLNCLGNTDDNPVLPVTTVCNTFHPPT